MLKHFATTFQPFSRDGRRRRPIGFTTGIIEPNDVKYIIQHNLNIKKTLKITGNVLNGLPDEVLRIMTIILSWQISSFGFLKWNEVQFFDTQNRL